MSIPSSSFVAKCIPSVSADHPEFRKPIPYRMGHTENYYRMNEIVSWAQKEVRRCHLDMGAFVYALLLRAGYADKGFKILFTVAKEDIGKKKGCLQLPF